MDPSTPPTPKGKMKVSCRIEAFEPCPVHAPEPCACPKVSIGVRELADQPALLAEKEPS